MKHAFFIGVLLLIIFRGNGQKQYQLAEPLLQYRSAFFKDTAMLQMHFRQASTAIHYTINGSDPKETDAVYKMPLVLKDKISIVKARAFGNDFLPSEIATLTFIKTGLPFSAAEITKPDEKYKANGAATLTDNIGGIPGHGNGTWLGYQDDSVTITLNADKPLKVSEVLLDFLRDEGTWIFLPESISVFAENGGKLQQVATDVLSDKEPADGSHCLYRELKLDKPVKTAKLLIKINTVKHIPGWHPGKGNHAWMFIDEIKVY
ncbi:MAG TPA: FN3 associated domain-containing protein [Panacibacter sp.]|nr:FN3 associated domain-containing protein [Panacibacter sp.]HNP44704.1 FN3 associated domain-containing protein [Panacibacter sp.]